MPNEIIPEINGIEDFATGSQSPAATSELFNAVWQQINAELNKIRDNVVIATATDVQNSEINKLIDAYNLNQYRPKGSVADIVNENDDKYPDAAAIYGLLQLKSLIGNTTALSGLNLDIYTFNMQAPVTGATNGPATDGYFRVVSKDSNNLVQYFTALDGREYIRVRNSGLWGAWKTPLETGSSDLVWSGPATQNVNLSTLPGGHPGDGLYLIRDDVSDNYAQVWVMNGKRNSNLFWASTSSSDIRIYIAAHSNSFLSAGHYKVAGTGPSYSYTSGNITEVWKVK